MRSDIHANISDVSEGDMDAFGELRISVSAKEWVNTEDISYTLYWLNN